MKRRKQKKYVEKNCNTDRYMRSSIPYMLKLLNKRDNDMKSFVKSLSYYTNDTYLNPTSRVNDSSLNEILTNQKKK